MKHLLLTEKYRPQYIEDVIGNEGVVKVIKKMDDAFPHLMLCGPPGTGKTTIAKIIAKKFEKVLELNASDERGIEVVRNRIKSFTQINCENKLIILDECDNLTTAAQQALRRIMETKNTKFILICNIINKVIEPIQSRTAILKFERISIRMFIDKIKEICVKEGIFLTESGFNALIDLSEGDFRSCLNILQGVIKIDSKIDKIDDTFLYDINGFPHKKQLLDILNCIKKRDERRLIEVAEELFNMKYDYADIINGLFKIAKDDDNYEFLQIIAEFQVKISNGLRSKMQFYAMFGHMMNI